MSSALEIQNGLGHDLEIETFALVKLVTKSRGNTISVAVLKQHPEPSPDCDDAQCGNMQRKTTGLRDALSKKDPTHNGMRKTQNVPTGLSLYRTTIALTKMHSQATA